jgi:hypothetical protein
MQYIRVVARLCCVLALFVLVMPVPVQAQANTATPSATAYPGYTCERIEDVNLGYTVTNPWETWKLDRTMTTTLPRVDLMRMYVNNTPKHLYISVWDASFTTNYNTQVMSSILDGQFNVGSTAQQYGLRINGANSAVVGTSYLTIIRVDACMITPTATSTPTITPTPSRTPTPTNTRTPTPFATIPVDGQRVCFTYRPENGAIIINRASHTRFVMLYDNQGQAFDAQMIAQAQNGDGSYRWLAVEELSSNNWYYLTPVYGGVTVDRWRIQAISTVAYARVCSRTDVPTVVPTATQSLTPGSVTPYVTGGTWTPTPTRTPTSTATSTSTGTPSSTPTNTRTSTPTPTFPPGCDPPPPEDYAECELIRLQLTEIALRQTMDAPTATWVAPTMRPTATYIPMDAPFDEFCSFEPCYTTRAGVDAVRTMVEAGQSIDEVPCTNLPWIGNEPSGDIDVSLPMADVAVGYCWFVERYQPFKPFVNAAWYVLNGLFLLWYFLYSLRRLAGMGGRGWPSLGGSTGEAGGEATTKTGKTFHSRRG